MRPWLRPLGATGITVSALGLGTVKFGRNQAVKYPDAFALPDDAQLVELLAVARECGITLLDTAPAYGNSEERLGSLLQSQRKDWVLVSKVGESFANGDSHFDFSATAVVRSVEASLRRLRTDWLDAVLIHSDGNDLAILDQHETLDALQALKRRGLVRAIGMSTKTVDGGVAAAGVFDIVMATLNPAYQSELPVFSACAALGTGVLVKKLLGSGHGVAQRDEALCLAYAQAATASAIVGTLSPQHLRDNAAAARRILEG